MQKSKPTHKSQAHNHLILVYNQTFPSLIRSRLALMVLAVLVEIVPVNDKRVDMPRLAFIRSGHPGVPCTMVVNRVLESLVWLAQRDGDVLPRVVAQSAAGVLVAFIGRVYVLGIGGFFCTISLCLSFLSPSHISPRFPDIKHTIGLSGDLLAINGDLLGDLVAIDFDGKINLRVLRHSDIRLLHLASCIS